MSKKRLDKCKSGKDFVKYAERHQNYRGGRQKGSHRIIKGTKPGIAVIPVHGSKDLPTGTRHSVIKMLTGIGITLLILACLTAFLILALVPPETVDAMMATPLP